MPPQPPLLGRGVALPGAAPGLELGDSLPAVPANLGHGVALKNKFVNNITTSIIRKAFIRMGTLSGSQWPICVFQGSDFFFFLKFQNFVIGDKPCRLFLKATNLLFLKHYIVSSNDYKLSCSFQ